MAAMITIYVILNTCLNELVTDSQLTTSNRYQN